MLVKEKTMKNNYLITVTNEDILNLKVKNINFLFPIKGYSVGYLKTYSLEDISVPNSYIYLNRILNKEDIASLKEDLKNLNKNIIGICFTDLGIIRIVKELGLKLQLIYMQSHNTTNATSINYYLEDVDSTIISTDITEAEIITILDKANKPLVVPFFGLADVMYSRRSLLTNFQEEFALDQDNQKTLHEPISNQDFYVVENEYGTVFYTKKYYDYRRITHSNILYYYLNPIGLTKEEVESIIEGKDFSKFSDTGFLDKKTVYNLKEVPR